MNEKVPVQLLFFASAKDLTGISSKKEFLLSSSTSSTIILDEVSKDFPGLQKLKGSIIISVNQQYYDCDQEINLSSGDEIAFIPPISGVEIKKEPVSDEDLGIEITESKSFPHTYNRDVKCELHGSSKKGKNDPTFVQITAQQDEMERRIKAFEERKREELNILNIQQFCMNGVGEADCARTAAILMRHKDSTSHVKITKVNNDWGPQTSIINFESLGPTAGSSNLQSDGIEERIDNLEKHLHMNSIEETSSVPIYARISALEKKVLFLEGLSPEYFNVQKIQRPFISNLEEEEEEEDDDKDFRSSSGSSDDEVEDIEYGGDQDDDITLEQLEDVIEKMEKKKNIKEFYVADDSSSSSES